MDAELVGMDTNNWRSTQGSESAVDSGDWRSQLPPDSRQRIVNKIMDTLKRHLPCHGPDGLQELKKIAIRFEEKIYSAATSQTDYLRKISLKMLTMETKSQNNMVNPTQPNSAISNNKNPQDPGSHSMQSQAGNQGQQMPMQMGNNQVQARQQLISQNIQNNIAPGGVQQGSSGLTSGMASINGLPSTNMPNVASQNPNMQNMSGVQQNLAGNAMGQGISSNMMVNSQQRQMQGGGRQHIMPQQPQQQQQQQQQSQNQQNYLYQQQLQQQLMKPKYQQGNLSHSSMQSHVQQQQSQQQPNIMQSSSQQQVMQPSVMQSGSLSGLQQNQPISVQQPTQTGLQQNSQAVFRQQQQQNSMIHQQQQTGQPMQQHQLIGQQPNATNIQQQLIGQQNNISDMQQQQQQQQRMLSQQNNIPNMQSQQQLMSQTNNLSNVHHQSMGSLNNVVGLPQQSLVTQSGSSTLQTNQHSLPIMQQPKNPLQQQSQQGNTTLLPNLGGQPSQQQPASQQSMAQIQSQTGQLHQQLGMQQQSSSIQRDLQQRHQTSGPLLQQQNMIDQQKQLYQSQRAVSEASSTSLDSTVQTGTANSGDWQEEVFQKVKALKETYLPELAEMYQKIAVKLQQHDSQPQQPKNDQVERLKIFKTMLERIISLLQIPKNNISLSYRDKLPSYEKQIINFLNSNRPRKQGSIITTQGPQLGQSQMQSMQQQQLQQHSQMQPLENQMNTQQLQQMGMQNSVTAMTGLQQNPLPPSLTGIPNSLQPSSNDPGQSNHLNNMQQPVPVGSLQQNPMSVVPQQVNMNNVIQQNLSSVVQSNAAGLPSQQIKQEQQMLQNQPLKQQIQQRQIQQQMIHRQLLQQQQQQPPQMKQQQTAQLQPHQMSQLHQMSDINDLKMRQQLANKSGIQQQPHSAGQRAAYQQHQQMKSTTSFPISSPQLLQAASSPQLLQHPSPQIDQQNMLSSLTKTGTPLQSINSPYIIPSPPTPLVPSPMPGESEKVVLPNAGNIGHQQASTTVPSSQSLAIGTPGISPSPLLESTSPENHVNPFAVASGKSSITELPMERLLRVVKSMSPSALSDSVSDIGSIVGMFDRIAGSAPGNGSRAAVGEDLAAMTKCRLQARNFAMQDGANGMRKMKRYTTANFVTGSDASDAESTATSGVKWPRLTANHFLLEEIRKINERLIETVVDISDDEEVDPIASAAAGEGTIVKCSYAAVALSPTFKAQYASAKMSQIQPLRMLVPNNYPNCSPIFMDKFPTEPSKESEDLSAKTKSRFSKSLRTLSQPMSLGEIAKMWDVCARAVILEYAQQNGGGSFSSKYGSWENCFSTV